MKIFYFLIIIELINLFSYLQGFYKCCTKYPDVIEERHNVEITSQDNNLCRCQNYQISQLSRIIIKMKSQGETVFKQANDAIGSGLIGTIYHAYWPSKNICVAIKVVFKNSNKKAAKNELKVLKVISSKPEEERDYLIYMYGYYLKPIYLFNQSTYMKIIMELGEKNLYDYFLEKNQGLPISEENEQYEISAEREQLLTNIFKCSAKGVEQFHKIGIHMDIKVINFVVIKNINLEEQFKCKLIDFNSSIITNDDFKILKRFIGTIECLPQEFFDEADTYGGYKATRQVDIWAFGVLMTTMMRFRFNNGEQIIGSPREQLLHELEIYRLNINYNTRFDRILKGCIQLNPYNRPSMTAIVRFLEDKCDGFIYEEGNYQGNRIC